MTMQKRRAPQPPAIKPAGSGYQWSFVDFIGRKHSGTSSTEEEARSACCEVAVTMVRQRLGDMFVNAMPPGTGRNSTCMFMVISGTGLKG